MVSRIVQPARASRSAKNICPCAWAARSNLRRRSAAAWGGAQLLGQDPCQGAGREQRQVHRIRKACTKERIEQGADVPGGLRAFGAISHQQHQGVCARLAGEIVKQAQTGLVGGVQVVGDQHHRRGLAQGAQEAGDKP